MSEQYEEQRPEENQDASSEDTKNSYLGLSDEEILNMEPSELEVEGDPIDYQDEGEEASSEEEAQEETEQEEDADSEEDGDEQDETDTEAEEGDEDEDSDAEAEEDESEDDESAEDEEEDEDSTEEEDAEETDDIDYKAEYEKLLAPFKANGKQLQVKNVDEAIQLMQMGANYNKKMAALKPNLKMLKLLENNNLLDQQKLSFLIDLDKKDPEAVKKLVKDSGVDPLEINTDEESDYKPNTYTVHDREIELDSVLDDIQDTPSYSKTIDVVSNKWDSASKQVIAQNPQLLKVINDHVASGVYERISKEIESERLFGRLEGLSDIEAYRQVGDAIEARGGFADLVQQETKPAPQKRVKKVEPAPSKRKKAEDPKLKRKKQAASTTKAAASPKGENEDFNPLSLSDEEFSKLVDERLM